ncbi:phosphotransferase family protein [Yinghuangia seranimata]|uniref:phosphotransferase family protein n=1 Tax=Yinghuangia seranimata TaxID=408067 RepID=UPI00248AA41E|nr:phosphotransferase [Yinghuangia seranimata]MDI2127445.1 phosphotransferase [Yinghuangia seranimata]
MRVDFRSLPAEVYAALTDRLGAPVASATTRPGGFSGGVAARAVLTDGRTVFVKGCPVDHPVVAQYEVEAWFGRRLADWTPGPPAPALLGELTAAGWYLLLFEDVDGHDARLADPADLAACLTLCDRLTATPYPAAWAHRIPPVMVSLGHLTTGWRRIAEAPPPRLDAWARSHLDTLCTLEAAWPRWGEGGVPAHTDLHGGNVLVRRGPDGPEAVAVDWTRPSVGAAWVDPLLFCLRDPDVPELPAWFGARYDLPRAGLTAFLAGAAGHWTDAARLEPPPYAPGLRAYEAARAAKALRWLRAALDRPFRPRM